MRSILILLAAGLLFASPAVRAATPPATRGMVASGHPRATQAGLNVLKAGGNAIDAAVAVGLTLGVVDVDNSGIGGGCFMLIRRADGDFVTLDGREVAPAAATPGMFVRDGKAAASISQTGALASGVPGEVAAFEYAVRKFGRKKLSELILPAAEIADEGFLGTTIRSSRSARLADRKSSRPCCWNWYVC